MKRSTPVTEALLEASKNADLIECGILLNYFPQVFELESIIISGIKKLFFIGELDNMDSVKYLKSLGDSEVLLEICRVKTS